MAVGQETNETGAIIAYILNILGRDLILGPKEDPTRAFVASHYLGANDRSTMMSRSPEFETQFETGGHVLPADFI
jgi:hypothetical protein